MRIFRPREGRGISRLSAMASCRSRPGGFSRIAVGCERKRRRPPHSKTVWSAAVSAALGIRGHECLAHEKAAATAALQNGFGVRRFPPFWFSRTPVWCERKRRRPPHSKTVLECGGFRRFGFRGHRSGANESGGDRRTPKRFWSAAVSAALGIRGHECLAHEKAAATAALQNGFGVRRFPPFWFSRTPVWCERKRRRPPHSKTVWSAAVSAVLVFADTGLVRTKAAATAALQNGFGVRRFPPLWVFADRGDCEKKAKAATAAVVKAGSMRGERRADGAGEILGGEWLLQKVRLFLHAVAHDRVVRVARQVQHPQRRP